MCRTSSMWNGGASWLCDLQLLTFVVIVTDNAEQKEPLSSLMLPSYKIAYCEKDEESKRLAFKVRYLWDSDNRVSSVLSGAMSDHTRSKCFPSEYPFWQECSVEDLKLWAAYTIMITCASACSICSFQQLMKVFLAWLNIKVDLLFLVITGWASQHENAIFRSWFTRRHEQMDVRNEHGRRSSHRPKVIKWPWHDLVFNDLDLTLFSYNQYSQISVQFC